MEVLDPDVTPIVPRPAGCAVPLPAVPRRLWTELLERGTRLSDMRTCAAAVRVRGPLNVGLLQHGIDILTRRHEALRTRIVSTDGIPRQRIDPPPADYRLDVADLSGVPVARIEPEAKRLAEAFIDEEVDVGTGPLFAAKVIRLGPDENVVILAFDHIISDAVSWAILSREVWTLYDQAVRGVPCSLPPLPVQFGDYTVWQERTCEGWLLKHGAHWKKHLAGARALELPTDRRGEENGAPTFVMRHFPMGNTISASLRDLALRERVRLPLVVLAAYIAVMMRWCDQRDLVFTSMSHARHGRPELQHMVGFLANRQFLRVEVSEKDTFIDLLKKVDEEFRAAQKHHDFDRVPDLVPECRTEMDFNWLPGNWGQLPAHPPRSDGPTLRVQAFPLNPFPPRRGLGAFKLVPLFSAAEGGVSMSALYRPTCLAEETIEWFGKSLRRVAGKFAEQPSAMVSSVSGALRRGESA